MAGLIKLTVKNNKPLTRYTPVKVKMAFHLVLSASIQAKTAGSNARKTKFRNKNKKRNAVPIKINRLTEKFFLCKDWYTLYSKTASIKNTNPSL